MTLQKLIRFSALVLCWNLYAFALQAQQNDASEKATEENNTESTLFYNLEGELQLGYGGGPLGFMAKANHQWLRHRGLQVLSGLSLSSFFGTEESDFFAEQITGRNTDTHLRIHTGVQVNFIRQDKVYALFEVWGGAFLATLKGNYSSPEQGIDRDYVSRDLVGDFGTRLGLGYKINPHWGIQLSLSNSWKQAGFGLGVPAGLLAGEVDGKTIVGLGTQYRF